MDIKESDFSAKALEHAKRISSGIAKLAETIKDEKTATPFADRLLLTLLVDSRHLLDFVAPLKSVGEIHGMPKHATDGADRPEPIVFRKEDPSKDFGPWWLEKTSRIHAALFMLAEWLQQEPSELNASLINLRIGETNHVISSVIQLLEDDLIIREVKIEGNEED